MLEFFYIFCSRSNGVHVTQKTFERMEQTRLFCNPNLTLKEVSNTLGLTQKRLQQLLKNDSRYRNLSGYLNEKRFLLACRLLRDEPQWTIEAVAKEVGFSNRLMEHVRIIGLTVNEIPGLILDSLWHLRMNLLDDRAILPCIHENGRSRTAIGAIDEDDFANVID